jgi:hypothetical protein
VVAVVEDVNVYAIKDLIQMIIAGIVPDLIRVGVPGVSFYIQVLRHTYSVQ